MNTDYGLSKNKRHAVPWKFKWKGNSSTDFEEIRRDRRKIRRLISQLTKASDRMISKKVNQEQFSL